MGIAVEAPVLDQHYAAQYEALKKHGLGILNINENPIPRPARFGYEALTRAAKKDAWAFRTPLPNLISGCKCVLLGCGTGQDAFVLAKLVGSEGSVIAIDPSADNIEKANALVQEETEALGVEKLNLEFRQGYPERLDLAGIEDGTIDSVIFNLTFNLAYDQQAVVKEIWRVLVPGGEMYGNLLTADRRFMPALLAKEEFVSPVIRGAVYLQDFKRLMRNAGWDTFRYMQKREAVPTNKKEEELLEEAELTVRFIRIFKLNLEDRCENYGQSAEYLGDVPECNQYLDLDDVHRFFVDHPDRVCGNTCDLLQQTRFAKHFRIFGNNTEQHYGIYDYCYYDNDTIHDMNIIEYNQDGLETCVNCAHKAFCTVDGHCQPKKGVSKMADRRMAYKALLAEERKAEEAKKSVH